MVIKGKTLEEIEAELKEDTIKVEAIKQSLILVDELKQCTVEEIEYFRVQLLLKSNTDKLKKLVNICCNIALNLLISSIQDTNNY